MKDRQIDTKITEDGFFYYMHRVASSMRRHPLSEKELNAIYNNPYAMFTNKPDKWYMRLWRAIKRRLHIK